MDQEFYLRDVWSRAQTVIKNLDKLGDDILNLLGNCKLQSLNDKKAYIQCEKFIEYCSAKDNVDIIQVALEQVLNTSIDVEVYQFNQEQLTPNQFQVKFLENKLNPKYIFSNFVIGKSNSQAHFGALTCANNPGSLYNPLFIYGQSGIGKTHLLNAVGNYITNNFKEKHVALISSTDLVEAVFRCYKEGTLSQLKQQLSQVDVLLVDDIQFIAGKDKTHEIFFSVFNELVSNHKQIVLTADRDPNDIKGLEERIISRFNSGLKLNISAPEFETSVDILKMKLNNNTELKHEIDEEAINYLASNFSSDVRSLEGALNRLIFFTINYSKNGKITLQDCLEAFKGEVTDKEKELTISKIIKIVCNYQGLTKAQLTGKSRTKPISMARQQAIYLCRKYLNDSYAKIGEKMGNRDHSTIMTAYEKAEKDFKENDIYRQAILEMERLIKS